MSSSQIFLYYTMAKNHLEILDCKASNKSLIYVIMCIKPIYEDETWHGTSLPKLAKLDFNLF